MQYWPPSEAGTWIWLPEESLSPYLFSGGIYLASSVREAAGYTLVSFRIIPEEKTVQFDANSN
jgi:hypothetical protein